MRVSRTGSSCLRGTRLEYLPRIPGEDRPRLGVRIAERHETWVAEDDGHVIGFAQVIPYRLENLYVDPDAQGRGVGTALLDHVKHACPNGFELWVFQENEGARRFYERHGCRLVAVAPRA